MKSITFVLALALTTATAAQAYVPLPVLPWDLQFPQDGSFPIKPKQVVGK